MSGFYENLIKNLMKDRRRDLLPETSDSILEVKQLTLKCVFGDVARYFHGLRLLSLSRLYRMKN